MAAALAESNVLPVERGALADAHAGLDERLEQGGVAGRIACQLGLAEERVHLCGCQSLRRRCRLLPYELEPTRGVAVDMALLDEPGAPGAQGAEVDVDGTDGLGLL